MNAEMPPSEILQGNLPPASGPSWKYVFTGTIYPERALINIPQPITIGFSSPDSGLAGTCTFNITYGQLVVSFDSATEVTDLYTLRNTISEFAHTIVDLACIETLFFRDIDIKAVFDVQKGATHVFGVDFPGLSPEGDVTVDIGRYLPATSESPYFQKAVTDLKYALKIPAETGFFCYRAFEALIHDFRTSLDLKDKLAGIGALEAALHVHPECGTLLMNLAGEVRHGHPVWISGYDRMRAIKITKELLQRFAAYKEEKQDLQATYALLRVPPPQP